MKNSDSLISRVFIFVGSLNENLWDLVKVNLLFLISVIPLFTLGPALTALFISLDRMSDIDAEKEEGVFSFYKRSFLLGFRQSLFPGIVFLAASLLTFSGIIFYLERSAVQTLFVLPAACTLLIYILLCGILFHLFPMCGTAETDNLLQEAARRALYTFGRTAAALVSMALLLFFQVLSFPLLLPLTLALGFSVPAFMGRYLVRAYAA